MGRLEGKTALVTGAASGLGAACAAMLAAEGARVAASDLSFTGDLSLSGESGIERAAASAGQGEGALRLRHDVTSERDWADAIETVLARFGRLDILVNSAGILLPGDIEATSLADWRSVLAVNLDGTFLGCKYGVRAMKETGSGSIINICSVSGMVGGRNLAAYNASKGGVRLLTKSVALHCARKQYGIRCNSIHPTFIETPMLDDLLGAAADPEAARASLIREIPLGRLGSTQDVGHMIVYLASDDSAFVTGAEMLVDGGATA